MAYFEFVVCKFLMFTVSFSKLDNLATSTVSKSVFTLSLLLSIGNISTKYFLEIVTLVYSVFHKILN
jgi:hypothetical protein